MSKKKSGCGSLVLLVLGIIVVVAIMMSKQESPRTSSPQPTAPAPTKPVPKITAGLSKFTVDRANAQFVFTLEVSNQESKENAIRVVVYGRNDMFSPPRRSAWPAAGLLFHQAGTRRGALSSSDVSRNWSSRPDN
ncbi:MAG: hypothetical protein KAT56_10820, partial [Sedimentisphaerales bacterium]|nr:hypothetical protein [Sedimentisphaerales bacterium]